MDFSGISLALAISQILASAFVVISGYAGIWAVKKVINLFKNDSTSDFISNQDHLDSMSEQYGPPKYGDYDPNGYWFRRDGMWRRYKDFE